MEDRTATALYSQGRDWARPLHAFVARDAARPGTGPHVPAQDSRKVGGIKEAGPGRDPSHLPGCRRQQVLGDFHPDSCQESPDRHPRIGPEGVGGTISIALRPSGTAMTSYASSRITR